LISDEEILGDEEKRGKVYALSERVWKEGDEGQVSTLGDSYSSIEC